VPWCVPAWGRREFLATARCILTGKVVDGAYPKAFADAVKNHLGLRYALAVNRGRTAIELALRAMGVGKEDEVIFPSYVCRSVLDAVVRVGATPAFADIGPDLQLTADTVRDAITSKTKCVIVPHLFCKTAPIDKIEKMLHGTGIWLIDDAAQLFGSRCSGRLVGTFGDCGIISCGPGKTLAGAAGGLLVTNNRDLYEKAGSISLSREKQSAVSRRVLSFWIWRRFRKYTLPFKILIDRVFDLQYEEPYVFCAMSNIDAAIALAQFNAMYKNDKRRRRNADRLLQALGAIANCSINEFSRDDMFVKLVLVIPEKGPQLNQVIRLLANMGIECQGGYTPLHKAIQVLPTDLPITERLWSRVLCVPIDSEFENTKKIAAFANELFSLGK
jgi:dTDP-4-amino-4,6-dideoxygalactose transaminase